MIRNAALLTIMLLAAPVVAAAEPPNPMATPTPGPKINTYLKVAPGILLARPKPAACPGAKSKDILLSSCSGAPGTHLMLTLGNNVTPVKVLFKQNAGSKMTSYSATVGRSAGAYTLTVPPPRNVQVARGTEQCAAHVGLFGALTCPALIKSGDVLLVWDWQAGAGPAAIGGFRVYRVTGGTKQLVYTRTDQDSITLVDLSGPAAGYVGACFAVSAYAGAYESALSAAHCVTRQETVVLASPTVNPTSPPAPAPKHVVIHVTGDSFPANTVVAAGGDVTWINDDTDEHSVYGPAGQFVGDLYASGGRFTYTFRDIGKNYTVPYLCQYHAGMHGTIAVVTNH